MDFTEVPIGFGMALAMNAPAMEVYAGMSAEEKEAVIGRARKARSEAEMHRIVDSLRAK